MGAAVRKLLKLIAFAVGVVLVTIFAVRAFDAFRGPPLEPWHTFVPHELSTQELEKGDLSTYLAAEDKAFEEVRREVTDTLDALERVPANRYFSGSPLYPPRFPQDFNRTYTLEPEGPAKGVAVLLHGLTDSPYSLRHVGERYRERGFFVIALRIPGHGTVPGALSVETYEHWMAAVRLAVRAARAKVPAPAPLHVVGYSNGGALALKYALEALDDPALARPSRLVLLSPMVGVTPFARFAGLAGLPAFLPPFANAAWLAILPEYNPFKYNSFPVNGGRQSHRLSQAVQEAVARHAGAGRLKDFPPVLTFQSVLDATVSARAVASVLHARLPDNGSELVLIDINRNAAVSSLVNRASETVLARLLPPLPRDFATRVVTNRGADTAAMEERIAPAGASVEEARPLELSYPRDVFSLSHIAVPFPVSDGLYGIAPDPGEDFGIRLGTVVARGETGALIASLDTLMRMSSNPFFPYLLARLDAFIAEEGKAQAAR